MIVCVHGQNSHATALLTEALAQSGPARQHPAARVTVVAYGPRHDRRAPDNDPGFRASATWAAYLTAVAWQHREPAGPTGRRRPVGHAHVRLNPDDRALTGAEWSDVAYRLARAVGLTMPGGERGCHWIAVQTEPDRLDLLVDLGRPGVPGTRQPVRLSRLLGAECRRIERDLGLRSPHPGAASVRAERRRATQLRIGEDGLAADCVEAATKIRQLLSQLADEHGGPLATVRGQVERAAHHLGRLPHARAADSGHQLELIARRLFAVQRDLDTASASLPAAVSTRTTAAPRIPMVSDAGTARLSS